MKAHTLIYARYQAVDFDYLIHLPVVLFNEHPEALLRWQSRPCYLLIDKYQDTNDCQYQSQAAGGQPRRIRRGG